MNPKELKSKTDEEIILIIERPDEYQSFMVDLAGTELNSRAIPEEKLIVSAEMLYRASCQIVFNSNSYKLEAYHLPHSKIIKKARCNHIFKEEFDVFMDRRDTLNSGLKHYY
ncbi:MAG: hypothetical protein ACJASQ_000020 [Crocinitomicaceae bacterium]|jgi:hypothetical protein